MRTSYGTMLGLGGVALVAALAACSRDLAMSTTGSPGAVPATMSLQMGSGASVFAPASSSGPMASDSDENHNPMNFLRLRDSDVDSLTVNVTKVEVLAASPDTENAADSAAEAKADSGRHEDEDDNDHEEDERTWVTLDVTGGGHLNLLMLPDSASAGIAFASGTLAPGTYKHVRIFVTDPMLFLKHQIVTPAGDTLKAGVGLTVKIPSADSTGAAIKTDERFTVPTGGGTIKLFFDRDDTIRHIVVTGNGTIIVPPVIR